MNTTSILSVWCGGRFWEASSYRGWKTFYAGRAMFMYKINIKRVLCTAIIEVHLCIYNNCKQRVSRF
jgi:hypothetical protein